MADKTDRASEEKEVRKWRSRIKAADQLFDKWEREFNPGDLYRMWQGQHWIGHTNWRNLATDNLFWSTINSKMPGLLFDNPEVKATPKPGRIDDPFTLAEERAKLITDTLNSQISDPELRFVESTKLSLLEGFFWFSVVEVGFSSDYIDNPLAGKPVLTDDQKELDTLEPRQIVTKETLFVKRIPARQFRVSANNKNVLDQCDWCGYYEWTHLSDVKSNPNFNQKAVSKLRGSASSMEEALSASEVESIKIPGTEDAPVGDMIKLWRIWDLRVKKQFIIADGADLFLRQKTFETLPLADLRFYQRLDKWLPIPVSFQWKSVQDTINQCEEMKKVHRERAKRVYLADEDTDDNELSKLATCDDKAVLKIRQTKMAPLADAPLTPEIFRDGEELRNSFRELSGGSSEFQGQPESTTATQSTILASGQQIRDSYMRVQVAQWLARIARLILEVDKKLALPFWIKSNVDVLSLRQAVKSGDMMNAIKEAAEVSRVHRLWQQINSEDLEDLNLDISVEIQSMSPVAQQQDHALFMAGLATVMNPAMMGLLGRSDILLRKVLRGFKITSESEIQEIKQALQAASQAAQQAQLTGGGNASAAGVAALAGGPGNAFAPTSPATPMVPGAGAMTSGA